MSSIRQQVISAIVTALESGADKPANVVVGRSYRFMGDLSRKPTTISVVVKPGKESVVNHGTRAVVADRTTFIVTEISGAAADGESWDETLDAAGCYVVKTMAESPSLGGLVKSIEERESVWEEAEKNERETLEKGKHHILWAVQFYTKANNQESRP